MNAALTRLQVAMRSVPFRLVADDYYLSMADRLNY